MLKDSRVGCLGQLRLLRHRIPLRNRKWHSLLNTYADIFPGYRQPQIRQAKPPAWSTLPPPFTALVGSRIPACQRADPSPCNRRASDRCRRARSLLRRSSCTLRRRRRAAGNRSQPHPRATTKSPVPCQRGHLRRASGSAHASIALPSAPSASPGAMLRNRSNTFI